MCVYVYIYYRYMTYDMCVYTYIYIYICIHTYLHLFCYQCSPRLCISLSEQLASILMMPVIVRFYADDARSKVKRGTAVFLLEIPINLCASLMYNSDRPRPPQPSEAEVHYEPLEG